VTGRSHCCKGCRDPGYRGKKGGDCPPSIVLHTGSIVIKKPGGSTA
jgi:hypothetical protein